MYQHCPAELVSPSSVYSCRNYYTIILRTVTIDYVTLLSAYNVCDVLFGDSCFFCLVLSIYYITKLNRASFICMAIIIIILYCQPRVCILSTLAFLIWPRLICLY